MMVFLNVWYIIQRHSDKHIFWHFTVQTSTIWRQQATLVLEKTFLSTKMLTFLASQRQYLFSVQVTLCPLLQGTIKGFLSVCRRELRSLGQMKDFSLSRDSHENQHRLFTERRPTLHRQSKTTHRRQSDWEVRRRGDILLKWKYCAVARSQAIGAQSSIRLFLPPW